MEIRLDVSDLEAPAPLEAILDALTDMDDQSWLRVKHSRNPIPLYSMLQNMGYRWEIARRGSSGIEVLIWPEAMAKPAG